MKSFLRSLVSSPQFAVNSWKVANGLALVLLLITAFSFYSKFSERADSIIEDGKRVIISLPDGKVVAKKIEEIQEAQANQKAKESESEIASNEDGGMEEATQEEGGIPATENPADTDTISAGGKQPVIAVVLTGLGLSRATTEKALELPPVFTLSFSPYAHGLKEWIEQARKKGFEVMLDLPLEPEDFPLSDPGPYGLLIDAEEAKNVEQLNTLLSLVDGYIGVLASLDEKFSSSMKSMQAVLKTLKVYEVFLLYREKPRNYFIPQAAADLHLPVLSHEIILDEKLNSDSIGLKLHELEKKARKKGVAIGVGHPYPVTVDKLAEWINSLTERGIQVSPISDLLKEKKAD